MRLVKEVIITALFLALYAPLSLAIWYTTGRTANLVIVALIGLSIITAYLYIQIIRHELGWHIRSMFKRRFRRTYISLDDEPEFEEEPEDYEYEEMVGFRALFSNNKYGGVAT